MNEHRDRKIRAGIFAVFMLMTTACSLFSCLSSAGRRERALEYARIGDAWFELKKYDQAEKYYLKAHDADPDIEIGSYQLARVYVENGKYAQGMKLLDDLIDLDGENGLFLNLRAYALFKSGDAAAARNEYEKIIKRNKDNAVTLFNLSLIEMQLKEYGKALLLLEKLVLNNPKDPDVIILLARCCFESGNADRGFALLDEYHRLKADDSGAYRYEADRYLEKNEQSKALKALRACSTLSPKDARTWFDLAKLELFVGEDEKAAMTAYAKAVTNGFDDRTRISEFLATLNPERKAAFIDAAQAATRAAGASAAGDSASAASGIEPSPGSSPLPAASHAPGALPEASATPR